MGSNKLKDKMNAFFEIEQKLLASKDQPQEPQLFMDLIAAYNDIVETVQSSDPEEMKTGLMWLKDRMSAKKQKETIH